MQNWIITGAASGIGKGIALAALKRGNKVLATSRDKNKLTDLVAAYPDQVIPAELDLTKEESIKKFLELIKQKFEKIDVLVNNAGYGYLATVEEGKWTEIRQQFDVNLFGPITLVQAVLPKMRQQKDGAIINVSSINAVKGSTGSSFYAASKAALENISDVLEREVVPLGIKVMIVEPGGFQTDFYKSLQETKQKITDYDQQHYDDEGLDRKKDIPDHPPVVGDPQKAGEIIYQAIQQTDYPRRLLLGSDALEEADKELERRLKETKKWANLSKQSDRK